MKDYFISLTKVNDRIFKFLFVSMYTTAFIYFLIYCEEGVVKWDMLKKQHENDTGFRRPLLYTSWTPINTDNYFKIASALHLYIFVAAISIIITGIAISFFCAYFISVYR